jgi:hypothetical protein
VAGLDRAKALDPAGDARPEVQDARRAAGEALSKPPAPAPSSMLEPEPAPKSSMFAVQSAQAPKPQPKFNAKPAPTEFMNSEPANTDASPKESVKPEPPAPVPQKKRLPTGSKNGIDSNDFPLDQKK